MSKIQPVNHEDHKQENDKAACKYFPVNWKEVANGQNNSAEVVNFTCSKNIFETTITHFYK